MAAGFLNLRNGAREDTASKNVPREVLCFSSGEHCSLQDKLSVALLEVGAVCGGAVRWWLKGPEAVACPLQDRQHLAMLPCQRLPVAVPTFKRNELKQLRSVAPDLGHPRV